MRNVVRRDFTVEGRDEIQTVGIEQVLGGIGGNRPLWSHPKGGRLHEGLLVVEPAPGPERHGDEEQNCGTNHGLRTFEEAQHVCVEFVELDPVLALGKDLLE